MHQTHAAFGDKQTDPISEGNHRIVMFAYTKSETSLGGPEILRILRYLDEYMVLHLHRQTTSYKGRAVHA